MDKNSLLKEIGRRLKSVRASLNYSRGEMGAQFGISMTGYTKNENGLTVPRIGALYKLATRFNISLGWLICGINYKGWWYASNDYSANEHGGKHRQPG